MKKLDILFDTDVGSDCDDMMALTYLIYAQRHLNIELKAITHCHNDINGIPTIRALFKSLGEKLPPIGKMVCTPKAPDSYAKAVAEKFGETEDLSDIPDAVSVLRRALTESENAVICAVGPFTNIAALLESTADDISPLDGVALVKEKCAKVVVMGGTFTIRDPDGRLTPEWNAKIDAPATAVLARLCPVPLIFSPLELGNNSITGKPIMDKYGDDTPLSLSFNMFQNTRKNGGRHSWDPITAVYSVEGVKDFFELSSSGTVTVDDDGRTLMEYREDGLHSILLLKETDGQTEQQRKDSVASYIDSCAMKVHDEKY